MSATRAERCALRIDQIVRSARVLQHAVVDKRCARGATHCPRATLAGGRTVSRKRAKRRCERRGWSQVRTHMVTARSPPVNSCSNAITEAHCFSFLQHSAQVALSVLCVPLCLVRRCLATSLDWQAARLTVAPGRLWRHASWQRTGVSRAS